MARKGSASGLLLIIAAIVVLIILIILMGRGTSPNQPIEETLLAGEEPIEELPELNESEEDEFAEITTVTVTKAGLRGYGESAQEEDEEEDEDECDSGDTRSCGSSIGECERGKETCKRGEWGSCAEFVGPSSEVCDSLDNDCDGTADENFVGLGQNCSIGIGACKGFGVFACSEDKAGTICNATAGIPSLEICNDGLDNDCDGFADYNDSDCNLCNNGATRSCGLTDVGECSLGIQSCINNAWGDCIGAIYPATEMCNDGKDNDCDNLTDYLDSDCALCQDGQTRQCGTTDVGACSFGTETCEDGVWGSCIGAVYPSNEVCDDCIDNDCDGLSDSSDTDCQLCTDGETRKCGLTDVGACSFGTETCEDGAWGQCAGAINPTAEICDSADNDCDGLSDEVFTNLGEHCSLGIGVCERTGEYVCLLDGSGTECSAVPGEPALENCNDHLDNDCDGFIDNSDDDCKECLTGEARQCGLTDVGACSFGTETCENGFWGECIGAVFPVKEICNDCLDNDCDGLKNYDDPDCLMPPVCGNGIREDGEECDDGNVLNGDGCASDCRIEQFFCSARSQGYWKNKEGCKKGEGSSIWNEQVNELSENFEGLFSGISGAEICVVMDNACHSDMRCKASKMLLADELNIVAGYLNLNSKIENSPAAERLGLDGATVKEALDKIEEIISDKSSTKTMLEDAKDVAEEAYTC